MKEKITRSSIVAERMQFNRQNFKHENALFVLYARDR